MASRYSVLKERNFRNFFLGSFISFFGSGLHMIGASWYAMQATGMSRSVGAIWFLSLLSAPFLLFYSGAFIDRMDRTKLLINLAWMRGVLVLTLPLSIYFGAFSIWQLYLLTFINGIGFNISFPTEKALVQEMMGKEDLLQANSMIEVSIQIGVFLSAGLSGFIYPLIGISGILMIDSVTFFAGAWFFSKIKMASISAGLAKKERFAASVKNGWVYLLKEKPLFLFGFLTFLPSIVAFSFNPLIPSFVTGSLGGGAVEYGVVDMAYGVGAFLAGLLAPILFRKRQEEMSFAITAVAILLVAAFPSARNLYLATAVFLAIGLGNTSLRILLSTFFMRKTPKELMGRVMSVCMFNANILQLSSVFFVGYLADRFSPASGFYYLAGLLVVLLPGLILSRGTVLTPEPAVEEAASAG